MENIYFFSGSNTLFFIILLFSKRNKAVYDWFLIVWFSLVLFHILVFYRTVHEKYSPLLEVSSAAVFLNGPILWLYTKTLFDKRIAWKDAFHFLPFILNLIFLSPFIIQNELAPWPENTRILLAWAKLGSILVYCIWSISTINNKRRIEENNFSNLKIHHVEWLKMAFKAVLVLWFIGVVSQLIFQANQFELDPTNEDLLINLAASILVIFMGYYGFKQAPVFLAGEVFPPDQNKESGQASSMEKYQNSSLDDGLVKYHSQMLENLMITKKPFKDPDLSLSTLALELNLTPNQLSQVINQAFKKNFYEFVNSYRIEEVIQKLANGEGKTVTLLGIALDAGFNSKATFNRFFKKHTGKTPSEYLKSQNG